MKSKEEITERLTEIKGILLTLENKDALLGNLSCEEWEVMDELVGEQSALFWVIEK